MALTAPGGYTRAPSRSGPPAASSTRARGSPLRRLILFFATGALSGYVPLAPGTAGAAVGLALYLAGLGALPAPLYLVTLAAGIALAVWASDEAIKLFGEKDPPQVTIDEVVGLLTTLALVPTRGAFHLGPVPLSATALLQLHGQPDPLLRAQPPAGRRLNPDIHIRPRKLGGDRLATNTAGDLSRPTAEGVQRCDPVPSTDRPQLICQRHPCSLRAAIKRGARNHSSLRISDLVVSSVERLRISNLNRRNAPKSQPKYIRTFVPSYVLGFKFRAGLRPLTYSREAAGAPPALLP